MKLFLAIILIGVSFGHSLLAAELTGLEVINRHTATNDGFRDEVSLSKMRLYNAKGKVTAIREFEIKRLEETNAQGEKSMIKIIKPVDLRGTGLLSYQNKKRSDDQWLYLPALGKTKRIAGKGKSGRFIGSEFIHEDLLPYDANKYSYRYIKKELCGNVYCHVVESTPLFDDSAYSKTISWIRDDNYQNIKIDFYDKKSRLKKIAIFSNYKKLLGKFWRPYKTSMKNLLNGKKTDLIIEKLKIKTGLSNSHFTRSALER